MKNFLFPKRIVARGGSVQGAEALLIEQPLQIGLTCDDLAVINGESYLILDFGKEVAGGVRILTYSAQGNKNVRLRFGESLSECCAELGEDNATNDHALRDFTVQFADWSDMMFGNTGFRFLRIDAEKGSSFQFKAIVAATQIDGREQIGSFECDDPLLNDIWNTAAYTLRLCIQNGFLWDGIKRDRLVWVGDLYPMIRAVHCIYGDLPEIKNCLSLSQKEGIPPKWINNIPMYSFWWLIILADDYFHTGEEGFVREKLPFAYALLREIDHFVMENGETKFDSNFIDWAMHFETGESEKKRQDELTGVNALLRIALTKTQKLLQALGEASAVCERILARLNQKTLSVYSYKQAAALAVLSGTQTEKEHVVLKAGGAKGVSTFMAYPIFSALARFGEYDFSLRTIKEYYGKMLSLGATTFFEDFDVEAAADACSIDEFPKAGEKDFHRTFGKFCYKGFRHSLCHGWSSGVIPYISETILGMKEIKMNEFKIDAHLSHLKHVKGVYPTTWGAIEVEYSLQSDGTYSVSVHAPKEVKIVCVHVQK